MALLKIKEIAETLRVSSATVRRWIQSGLLPGIAVGSSYRVKSEDMAQFVESSQTDNTTIGQGETNV